MVILLPLAIAGVFVGGVLCAENFQKKRQIKAWTAAGDQVGLRFTPSTKQGSFGRLFGSIGVAQVAVSIFARGDKNGKMNYTRYRLTFPSEVKGDFRMEKQKLVSFIGRLLGKRYDRIGDPDFDSRVRLSAPDLAVVERYLTPARRIAVLRLMESFFFATISPGVVIVERIGVEKDKAKLAATIIELADIARVLSDPSDVVLDPE